MEMFTFNPLRDKRWQEFVDRHPKASAFHDTGWLQALSQTYGYKPIVLTTATSGQPLTNGIVLCQVSSWITGTRLVSLPFADHCEPLVSTPAEAQVFADWLRSECGRRKWKYVELRPRNAKIGSLQAGCAYCFHSLDLTPRLDEIFHRLHASSIQRKIKRGRKEKLSVEIGRSPELLNQFYDLLLRTRRRHQLLPQPRAWFENLIQCLGDKLQIRVASKDGIPIAAILTLWNGKSVMYKYGCSDERFHNMGGMPFLFWRLIEDAKAAGAEEIDFGRSDLHHKGLITFKDRFGATRKSLTYHRHTNASRMGVTRSLGLHLAQRVLSILPNVLFITGGRLFYRHMGSVLLGSLAATLCNQ